MFDIINPHLFPNDYRPTSVASPIVGRLNEFYFYKNSMNENLVTITENAAKRIKYLAEKEGKPDAKLRLIVDGGGCSGFQYRFDFPVTDINADKDTLYKFADSELLVIDVISLKLLGGAEIDFVETLGSSMFVVKNPNAKSGCGCGNSFAV